MSDEGFLPPIKILEWAKYDQLIDEQYDVFCKDFILNIVQFSSKPIIVKPQPTYDGKEDCFWHVVTREFEPGNPREADGERAVRVHWIRPLIDNHTNSIVTYFTSPTAKDRIRHYFWLKEDTYLIILEETPKRLHIVTAYMVDKKYMKEDLEKKFNTYVASQ